MSGAHPDYGAAFAVWRAETADWSDYVEHAFVAGLADGSLPRAAFLQYLRQDYIFLIHFSRAWALAVVKAGSLAEMEACSATVHALLHEEMPLHVKICGAAGISKAELEATREEVENLAYTRFVLDAGLGGDFLDMLAALAPCVLGYGEIGARLVAQSYDPAYADWIETYGGAEYQSLCQEVGSLIDGALADRLGPSFSHAPRWGMLCARFQTATRLEAGFWAMGLRGA